ncbi:carbohydrate kinase family protein [Labrys monachus]|uniref:Fructokinase n=1 Tax=Labrys monachus TaxID=217067 RepID=A0ABU0FET0_9HYPH|nr:carbohydrate kinase [Labrys monachus]MDQ0393118.1 fructokinase [Labrys monachus]
MILVCGEALIDFLPVKSADGREAYRPVVGGSPFNTAVGIGRLGGDVGFCAALSTDFFGDRLAEALERSKVSLNYVVRAPRSSMLAFVSMGDGEPEYAFIDDASAGRLFSPERDAPPIGEEVSMIWTGSVALINDPIASAYEKLYFDNKGRRVLGMDPNVRPTVVTDAAAYRARMKRMTEAAEIVKVSKADLLWLYPGIDPAAWARDLVGGGASLVVLTDGANGAEGYGRGFEAKSPVVPVDTVVDTVGAGDSYSSGLLTVLQRRGVVSIDRVGQIDQAIAQEAMDYAARTAAITVSREGADPPWNFEMA